MAPPHRTSCLACVKSKRRCDIGLPGCKRCATKGLTCDYAGNTRRAPAGTGTSVRNQDQIDASQTGTRGSPMEVMIFSMVSWLRELKWGRDAAAILVTSRFASVHTGTASLSDLIRGTHDYWYSWIYRYIHEYLYVFMKFKEIMVTSRVSWNFFKVILVVATALHTLFVSESQS